MSKGASGSIVGMVAVILVVVCAGCGGGSGSLTKAEFVKQGNAICENSKKERSAVLSAAIAKLESEHVKQANTALQEQLVLESLPKYEQATKELSELSPPEGDEAKVKAIVKAMEEAATNTKAAPATAIDGSVPFKQANKLATEYGLTSCAV